MEITKHARKRLWERFKIKSEADIHRLKKKFDRDYVRLETVQGQTIKTVVWNNQYMEGVFRDGVLITAINLGFTPLYTLRKDNPIFERRKGERRH